MSWLHASPWLHYVSIDEILRPYVFRRFIPFSARILAFASGLDYRAALVTLIIACAVGYLISTRYLYTTFFEHDARADLFVLLSAVMLFPILNPPHMYDIPTALFFTLEIALLARRRIVLYIIVFIFASLNRETAFLLPIVFSVHFVQDRKMSWKEYVLLIVIQVLIYGWIRYTVLSSFSRYPGDDILIRPIENLRMYLESPIQALVVLLLSGSILWMVVHQWRNVPEIIQTSFLIFTPILFLMYVISGKTFEIRVFIEVLPVLTIFLTTMISSCARSHRAPNPLAI